MKKKARHNTIFKKMHITEEYSESRSKTGRVDALLARQGKAAMNFGGEHSLHCLLLRQTEFPAHALELATPRAIQSEQEHNRRYAMHDIERQGRRIHRQDARPS